MLKSKAIDRICCAAAAVMLVLTAWVWTGKAAAGRRGTVTMGYEGLFGQSAVHTIDIEMEDWDGFIASAAQESYAECAVTIDGERISNVGIRCKGNTSLSSVASAGSRKYSFKIEFDQYVKGKTYRGLDKLSLNNLIYDATMMKDYLAYTLMGRMDVPSPLCSYAHLTVNGEPWGLYLAVEGVEDGFMQRNGMTAGALYKPDSLSFGGGRGNGWNFNINSFRQSQPNGAAEPAGAPSFGLRGQMPGGSDASGGSMGPGGMGPFDGLGFGMGSDDVRLAYIGDDPDSYKNIFDSAKTKISKKDKARLIASLRRLNAKEDIENTVFTDEVIRYLAVHDFLQNDDSYTGTMVHNYYLYEEKGKLAIIPWDYNLAFGGMSVSNGTTLVNSPIDTPVSGGTTASRPLVAWIFEDENALAGYHEAYDRFISENIESGWLETEISRAADLIRPYVEADAHSFFTSEAFDAAVSTLQSWCALRGESVRGQLNGAIPSTSAGQWNNSAALVNAGSLDVSAMGRMNADGNGAGRGDAPGTPIGFGGPPTGGAQMPGGGQNAIQNSPKAAPDRPGRFPPAPGAQEGGSPGGISWMRIGFYVLLLLLAIALVMRVPGRER